MIVIDASLVVKWYFVEDGSNAAIELLGTTDGEMTAPDLLAIEVCAALVRKGNMDKSLADDIRTMLADFQHKLIDGTIRTERATDAIIAASAELALNLGHPLKDCIYLAMAMERDCELVTCDAKFASKAATRWSHVRVLG